MFVPNSFSLLANQQMFNVVLVNLVLQIYLRCCRWANHQKIEDIMYFLIGLGRTRGNQLGPDLPQEEWRAGIARMRSKKRLKEWFGGNVDRGPEQDARAPGPYARSSQPRTAKEAGKIPIINR